MKTLLRFHDYHLLRGAKCLSTSVVLVVIVTASACAQDEPAPSLFLPNQEVRVANPPSLTATDKDRTGVLTTALEIIVHDQAICCGKDSALEDSVQYAAPSDPVSLRDLVAKLQGKHAMSD